MLAMKHRSEYPMQRRGALWLALFGIFVLQLSSAAHQFEHAPGYVDAACKICVQLDRLDDVVGGHAVIEHQAPVVGRLASPWSPGNAAQLSRRDFDARAPPSL